MHAPRARIWCRGPVGPWARVPRELGSGAVGPWACGPVGWICPASSDLVPWAQPQKIFGACGELLCIKDLVPWCRVPGFLVVAQSQKKNRRLRRASLYQGSCIDFCSIHISKLFRGLVQISPLVSGVP